MSPSPTIMGLMPCIMRPCEETPGMRHLTPPLVVRPFWCLSDMFKGMFKWSRWKPYPQDSNKCQLNTSSKAFAVNTDFLNYKISP